MPMRGREKERERGRGTTRMFSRGGGGHREIEGGGVVLVAMHADVLANSTVIWLVCTHSLKVLL